MSNFNMFGAETPASTKKTLTRFVPQIIYIKWDGKENRWVKVARAQATGWFGYFPGATITASRSNGWRAQDARKTDTFGGGTKTADAESYQAGYVLATMTQLSGEGGPLMKLELYGRIGRSSGGVVDGREVFMVSPATGTSPSLAAWQIQAVQQIVADNIGYVDLDRSEIQVDLVLLNEVLAEASRNIGGIPMKVVVEDAVAGGKKLTTNLYSGGRATTPRTRQNYGENLRNGLTGGGGLTGGTGGSSGNGQFE